MPELFSGADIAAASTVSAAAPDTAAVSDPSTAASGALPGVDTATTPQAAGDASATTQTDPLAEPSPNAPPEEKWPNILNNARIKAVQETEAKYSWAAKIPAQHQGTVGAFYALVDTEPVQAVEALIATIAANPEQAPKLRSLFGRMLGNRAPETSTPQGQPQRGTALPEPDFQDEAGNTFFSAGKVKELADAIEARIDAKYAKELHPLKTDLKTREQRAQEAKDRASAAKWADTRYAAVSQWPHYKESEAEIAAAMSANEDLEVADAYIQIVVPKLSLQERKAVVAGMHDKASASSVNPANPASAVSGPPKTFQEAFERIPAGSWGR